MSQQQPQPAYPQYPQQPGQATVHQQPTNTLGLAGFITSLVGIVTCGFISPVGLVLSLIGLTKQPRGFAVAGVIIGALGSIFLVVAGISIVLGFMGLQTVATEFKAQVDTFQTAQTAYQQVEAQRGADGAPPAEAEGSAVVAQHADAWGTPLRYEVSGDSYSIISAGRDQQFGTGDDLDFDHGALSDPTATYEDVATEDGTMPTDEPTE